MIMLVSKHIIRDHHQHHTGLHLHHILWQKNLLDLEWIREKLLEQKKQWKLAFRLLNQLLMQLVRVFTKNLRIFLSLSTKALVLSPMLKMVNLSTNIKMLFGSLLQHLQVLKLKILSAFIWVDVMNQLIFIIKIGKKFMNNKWLSLLIFTLKWDTTIKRWWT